ncbi:MAG TPA: hypothetical protein VJ696_01655 [Rhodanobacteraceae bacterium]|nr:hypothetical protein [Rhodanobacteraceae bacterium]
MDRESGTHHAFAEVPYAIDDDYGAASLGLEAVNALGTGIALIDQRGYVLFANTSAQRFQRKSGVFRTFAPLPLTLSHPESHEALRKAIVNASHGVSTALQLRDYHAVPAISAVVAPLRSSRWTSRRARPVVLAMNDVMPPRPIPDHWLSQLFGLTPMECSIANWLVAGGTIDEYAQHRGVSHETARSQLKAVLSKTGMSRQAQLVAALARWPTAPV